MIFNLDDPEKQQIILNRISQYDEKSILELFYEIDDEMRHSPVLDEFVVRAAIIIDIKIRKSSKTRIAETLIRQYSDEFRLPIRLTIYTLLQ